MIPLFWGADVFGRPITLGRVLAAGAAASIMTAIGCGAFRRPQSRDMPRLEPDTSLGGFFLLIPIAIVAYFLAVGVRFVIINALAESPFYPEKGSWWYVILLYLPISAAGSALVRFDEIMGDDTSKRLGYSLRSFPMGVLQGVLGAVIAFGPMLGVMVLTTLMYRRIGYTHSPDTSLQLLKHDHEHPIGKAFLILNLVWGVPFVEELFFRGHLQTALRETIIRLRKALYRARRWADDRSVGDSHPWATTLALVSTSLIFASLHPQWTWPQVFFSGVCFGYVYERTGNLYASVTLHGLFNASQILWVLSSRH